MPLGKGMVAGIALGLLSLSTLWLIIVVLAPPIPFLAPEKPTAPMKPTVTLTIDGGEISPTKFGFALEGKNLTSPGPTFEVKVGDLVQITFKNIGGRMNQPHTFVIVTADNKPAFENTGIGAVTNPIDLGKSGTAMFLADKAGDFTYICNIPGHKQLGMWGRFVVKP